MSTEDNKPVANSGNNKVLLFSAGSLIVGGAIGAVIAYFATKANNDASVSSASASASSSVPPMVPGWFAERTFHENAIVCPWTTNPLNDTDCQWRKAEITRMRNAIATCENPLAFNLEAIGHRGAALVAPEETIKSWQIGVDSGAGFIECDAAVTKDLQLTCRHSTCDLHFTTDILTRPEMVAKCSTPFTPASNGTAAKVNCCTYDFTMEEMSKLCSIMESGTNPKATTPDEYLVNSTPFRSVGLAKGECHKMVSHKDYLKFAKSKNVNVIPELKDTTEKGTQDFLKSKNSSIEFLADLMASELREIGFTAPLDANFRNAKRGTIGIMQTFDRRVARYWKTSKNKDLSVEYMWESDFNSTLTEKDCDEPADCGTDDVVLGMMNLGVELISPAFNYYVTAENHRIVESKGSKNLKALKAKSGKNTYFGSWSLERSGCASHYGSSNATFNAEKGLGAIGGCGWYYNTVEGEATFGQHEDTLLMLDVLFKQVGLVGLFSDFPASVSMYSNCILNKK
ncbi:PLC-like phosphodiesterase [Rhizoclosmatium globosum]|uniref:glycerophosphodiester phosphodiesterase n=1 Tax=Rhizoclosmatium globosum TaxID=329046 RepID=A0A1Y2BXU7_9FUNG|nr:PLC-like phosphodiesterase [Rhizoclosmatium globosum]|eukprot:ORY39592.1 PLC-like phosphodiesterase [Rhizoclosmatium globosum]